MTIIFALSVLTLVKTNVVDLARACQPLLVFDVKNILVIVEIGFFERPVFKVFIVAQIILLSIQRQPAVSPVHLSGINDSLLTRVILLNDNPGIICHPFVEGLISTRIGVERQFDLRRNILSRGSIVFEGLIRNALRFEMRGNFGSLVKLRNNLLGYLFSENVLAVVDKGHKVSELRILYHVYCALSVSQMLDSYQDL